MRPTGRVSRSRGARPITSSPRIGSGHVTRRQNAIQAQDGESVRIRILDYLGGGKLVVDLKGERVVANTALLLEKNQQIDVIVKNLGDKVILQLASDTQQNISLEPSPGMKLPLGDIIHQLMTSLESLEAEASPTLDDTLKELLQNVQELVQRIPVDVTEPDLPEQIKDAVNALGYDYERKLAAAFASGRFSAEEISSQLKAKLMQLRSALGEEPLQTRLLETIENVLENLEFQQLSSLTQEDKPQYLYLQIPVLMQDQMVTAELEFFRPKAGRGETDDDFNIVLNFDLQKLGHIEFAISVIDKHINCRVNADEYETYMLAKEQASALEGRLTALGYRVGGIHCALGSRESRTIQNQMDMDDIDITV